MRERKEGSGGTPPPMLQTGQRGLVCVASGNLHMSPNFIKSGGHRLCVRVDPGRCWRQDDKA